jgi:hypothetical protein
MKPLSVTCATTPLGRQPIDGFGSAAAISLPNAMGLNGYGAAGAVFERYFPGIGVSDLAALGASGSRNEGGQWNLTDLANIGLGRNEVKFGVDYRRVKSPTIPENPLAEAIHLGSDPVLSNSAAEL